MDNVSEEKEVIQESAAPVQSEKKPSALSVFTESLYEAVSVVITAIMIIAVVFTFGFRLVGVNGGSMNNTLTDGDWLLVTPYYGEPKYGDIVISTKDTAAEHTLVKRVIAVAGDEVVVDETDTVYVNGQKLDEDNYTINNGKQHGNLSYPITVPEDCVMLMGDNRPGSWDSRFEEIGFAETEFLLGKAQFRLGKNADIYENFKK